MEITPTMRRLLGVGEDQPLAEWVTYQDNLYRLLDMATAVEHRTSEGLDFDEAFMERYAMAWNTLRSAIDRTKAQAALIESRLAKNIDTLERLFRDSVEAAARRAMDGTNRRSVVTLGGTYSFRARPRVPDWTDTDVALRLAEELCPDAVEIPPAKVDKKALQRALVKYAEEHGGTLPTGVAWHDPGDSFTVGAAKEAGDE